MAPADSATSSHFIKQIVAADTESGRYDGRVHTRFPPEPNGYLHIGHAKSIWINFSLAEEFGGQCNLRFDDTNPSKEEVEFVESIKRDIRWLGYDWEDRLYFASDYFEQICQYAVALIEKGVAYVCDLTPEEVREYRGTLTRPGRESPYRNRSVEENRDLFERMRAGEFEDGSRTLRARIDMASPNINLRDPVLYRIQRTHHHRTGDEWCIYPMYDMAHGYSDSIEGITHSICTLEFENHRPLYDWLIEQLDLYHPQQIEFNRLNLTYTVMSKRKLRQLVEEGHVDGWDDPRMPTLSGMRRRGYTPQAIRNLCEAAGVSKSNSTTEYALVDHHVRQDLNDRAERRFGVIRPLKLILTNYPEDETEELIAENHPSDESAGTRTVPFSRELWIEQADFMEDPPKKFFRLSPGEEVRLRYAYIIKCHHVVKAGDEVVEIHCTYDPDSRSGSGTEASKRKVKGTIHWVSARHAVEAELRLYSHLFLREDPYEVDGEDGDFTENINPDSLEVVTDAKLEPSLAELEPGTTVQFERKGYFCMDPDSTPEALVFNRTVTLRDTWKKIQKQERHRQHQKSRRKK